MRKHLATVIVIIAVITGLSLLLYPTVSDYVNTLSHKRSVSDYIDKVEQIDDDTYQMILQTARDYNKSLLDRLSSSIYLTTDEERSVYRSMLDITGTGIMGYIEIPSIDVSLPIYHGTDESVLQNGVGHIDGSSLPVGGEGSHCILSGHRGLPSAKLFTNIDKLAQGDIFMLKVLNETLTYQVDQIQTVEPDVLDSLTIEKGKDYCTLVTCTPYGINTHRLLVRGKRIENTEADAAPVVPRAYTARVIDSAPVVLSAELPIIAITAIVFAIRRRRRR